MILYGYMAKYCKRSLSMDIEDKSIKLLVVLFFIKLYARCNVFKLCHILRTAVSHISYIKYHISYIISYIIHHIIYHIMSSHRKTFLAVEQIARFVLLIKIVYYFAFRAALLFEQESANLFAEDFIFAEQIIQCLQVITVVKFITLYNMT